jgi:hypothetical protein
MRSIRALTLQRPTELSPELFPQVTEWMEFGKLTVKQSLNYNFSPNADDVTIKVVY